jgi:hypothetical protein
MCGVAGQDDATLVPEGGQHDLLQGSPVDVPGLADRVADCADEAAEASEAFAELLGHAAAIRVEPGSTRSTTSRYIRSWFGWMTVALTTGPFQYSL